MKASPYIWKSKLFLMSALAAAAIAATAQAQTLSIVSGNGQVVPSSGIANQSLVVQLLDATGKPFPGQTITFFATAGLSAGNPNPGTAVTDSNGQASVQYIGASLLGSNLPFITNNVVASYGGTAVSFTETTTNYVTGSAAAAVQASVIYPIPGAQIALSGPAGSTGTQPIQVSVTAVGGSIFGGNGGVPGVAVTIVTDPASTGSISCKEGPYVLTDALGNANCTPLFGKFGAGTFTISVGGYVSFSNNPFNVQVGNPGIISILSGNNQSGLPGQTLPLPIVAQVSDLAGNILPGVGVIFTSVTPGGATFTNVSTTSDQNGRVSARVVLGNTAGPIQISVVDTGNLVKTPAIFTETVNINISAISAVSGNGQTAFINQPFAPLTVQVNGPTGQPVQGATVSFAVTSGSATLSPPTVVTGADGKASTTVTAGPTAGPITVTATVGGFSTTFSLTANPPGPTNFSYFNGASNQPNAISPGSIMTITAQGLVSNNIQGVVAAPEFGPLPYQLAGITVTINNIPAPLFNVQNVNGQQSVTLQIPYEVPAGTVPIKVTVAGGGSNSAFVTVNAVSPGFFSTVQSDGVTRAVALRPNGTVVTPQNPAARGENVRIYLTGLGPVSPTIATGNFSPAGGTDLAVTSPLVAGINNNGVAIVQAIYARNLIGAYEITIQVPDAGVGPSGSVPLSVAVQGPSGYVYSDPSQIVIQ
ncbi:MAG: Ig domain protein group 1 domain protein [Bryobacterales bacterium]|nr:Ig domain protein group 1 domain protein [Bryobacterales bacterium]